MKNLDQFLFDLAARESGGSYTIVNSLGYLGKYQMGEKALIDAGYYLRDGTGAVDFQGPWTGKDGIDSKATFLQSPIAQENAIRAYMDKQWGYIRNYGLDKYVGATLSDGTVVTESGLLAGAHLKGIGGLIRYIKSNGADDNADAYGTRISSYVRKFSGYDLNQRGGAQQSAQVTDFPDADIGSLSGTLVFADGSSLSYGGDTRIQVADDRRSTTVVQVLDAVVGIQIEYRLDAYGKSLGGYLTIGVGDPGAKAKYSFSDPSQITVAPGGSAFIVNDGTTGLYVNLASGDNLGNGNGGRVNLYFDPLTGQGNLYRQSPLTSSQAMETLPAGSSYRMLADGSLLITKPDSSTVKISAPGIAPPPGGAIVPGYTVVREIAPGLYLGKSSNSGAQALYVSDTGDNNPLLAWVPPGSTIKSFKTNPSDAYDSVIVVTDSASGARTYYDLTTRTVGRFDSSGNGEFVLPDGTRQKVSSGGWFITPNGSAAIYNTDGSVSLLSKVDGKVSFDTYQGPETARLLASGGTQIGAGDNADGSPRAEEVAEQPWTTGMTPLSFASAIGDQLASILGHGSESQVASSKTTLMQLTASNGEPTGATILSNGTVVVTIGSGHYAVNGEAAARFSVDEFNTLRVKVIAGPAAGQEAVFHNFSEFASTNPDAQIGGFIPTSVVLRAAGEAAYSRSFTDLSYQDDFLFSGSIQYTLDENGYITGNLVAAVAVSASDNGGAVLGTLLRDDEDSSSYLLRTTIGGVPVEFDTRFSDGLLTLAGIRSIDGRLPLFSDLVNATLAGSDINAKDVLLSRGEIGNVRQLMDVANPSDVDGVVPFGSQGAPSWFASGDPRILAGQISSLTALLAAIDSGNPLHIAVNAFNVGASIAPASWIGDGAGALGAISGLINFNSALQRGDFLSAFSGAGGAALTAIKGVQWLVGQQIAANWGNIETARVAVAAGDQTAVELVGQYDALDSAAGGISEALPYIAAIAGVIGALNTKHPDYADAVMSVVALIPFYGQIIYAAYQAGKFMHGVVEKNWGGTAADILVGPDEPIKWTNDDLAHLFGTELDIHAEAEFSRPETVTTADMSWLTFKFTGQEDGGEKYLQPVMEQLLGAIHKEMESTGKFPIAERMPKLSFRGWNDGEGGVFTLSWVDESSGRTVTRSFDQAGLFAVGDLGSGQGVAPADATVLAHGNELAHSPAFHASLPEAFAAAVLESGALTTAEEAGTAANQAQPKYVAEGLSLPPDPYAGMTTIARAREQGQLLSTNPGDGSIAGANAQQAVRPIILDFDGVLSPSDITRRSQGLGVLFDVDDDGYGEQTDWVGPRVGMLVMDRDGDGQIKTGHEIFSDSRVDMAARGLNVLRELDANLDGILNSEDVAFNAMGIWRDINHDGVGQTFEERDASGFPLREVTPLGRLSGIRSIDLNAGTFLYYPAITRDHPHWDGEAPGFDWTDPRTGRLWNADLQADAAGLISLSNGNVVEVVKETGEQFSMARALFDTVYAPQPTDHEHTTTDGVVTVYDQVMDAFEDTPLLVSAKQLVAQPSAGAELSFVGLGAAVGGSAAYNSTDGVVTFTPALNYNGSASFEYTMADANGRQVTAKALIAVTAINDAPVVTIDVPARRATVADYQFSSYTVGDGELATSYSLAQGAMLGEAVSSEFTVEKLARTTLFNMTGDLGLYDGKLAWQAQNTNVWLAINIGDAQLGSLGATDVETTVADLKFQLVEDARFGHSNFDEKTGVWHYVPDDWSGRDDAFIVDVIDGNGGKTRTRIVVTNPDPVSPDWVTLGGGGGGDAGGVGAPPVVLDLGSDGLGFIPVRDSSAFFDFNGDGVRERAGWIAGSDAFLIFDANGDGRVSGRSELVLKDLLTGAQTDLQGLAALDTNGDGRLSAADTQWSKLGTWQDRNENGTQDDGEFATLAQHGIQTISLNSDGAVSTVAGTVIHGLGTFTRIDGSTGQLADLSLLVSNEQLSATPNDSITAPAEGGLFDMGSGDDRFQGGAGIDEVYAGSGNDRVAGGAGDDVLDGNAGNDVIVGDGGNDRIFGGFGNDMLGGGAGTDQLFGNQGNDALQGGDGDDELNGQSGHDRLNGDAGNDRLFGGDAADDLFGGAGNDFLDGGADGDGMAGEAGNDVYRVDGRLDVVVEKANEGVDTVISTVDVDGFDYVENIVLAGSGGLHVYGSLRSDRLWGNQGDNLLDGLAGADVMSGGAGNDTYVVDNLGDVIEELADGTAAPGQVPAFGPDNELRSDFFNSEGHAGFTGTKWGIDTVISSVSWQLGPNVENLTLTGRGANSATGNALANIITGNDAGNTLEGGRGDDTLRGGAGFDTYCFALGDGRDRIEDTADGGQLKFDAGIAWTDLAISTAGNDLVIDVKHGGQATGDKITLVNWMTSAERVGSVKLADGTTYDLAVESQPRPAANHAPTALPDSGVLAVAANTAVSGNVLSNDSDLDSGDVLSVTTVGALQGRFGTLQLAANGTYTYSMAAVTADLHALGAGQQTVDVFDYAITDNSQIGMPMNASSKLTIRITGVNDAPELVGDLPDQTAKVGKAFELVVPAGLFSDADQGDTLTLSARLADGQALPAWLSFDAVAGRFSGTPPVALSGTSLQLRLTAADSSGAAVSETFKLDLAPAGITLTGTPAGEELVGSEFDDTFIGLAGNDTLKGAGGFDTYQFGRGDGADRIIDAIDGGRIVFGTGIKAADLKMTLQGSDAVIELLGGNGAVTGDRITLVDWTQTPAHVSSVLLADGQSISLTEGLFKIPGQVITGDGGVNTLVGGAGDDVITGFQGRDLLTGGGGSDRFVYVSILDAGDRITDFQPGIDRISVGQLLAGIHYAGSDPVADGTLSLVSQAGRTYATYDLDGSAGPQPVRLLVELSGVTLQQLDGQTVFDTTMPMAA